jgi:hypothetical protein
MDQGNDRWLTLLGTSQNALAKSAPQGCDPQTAVFLAGRLFGSFRAADANDPETFIAGATAIIAHYPEQIVRLVCYGLPSQTKWLPALAEIREACERAIAPTLAEQRRAQERAHTARVLAAVREAPMGSPEHRRTLSKFALLRTELYQPHAEDPPPWRTMTPTQAEANLARIASLPPVTAGPALRNNLKVDSAGEL